jgi:hypothetical protein
MLVARISRACKPEMEVEDMKKAQSLRLLGSGLVLTSLLGAVTLVMRNHASTHASIKSVFVSSSGQRLTKFFEESPRDPRYSSKAILATRRGLPKCGGKPEEPDVLQSLFGSAVVYAACHAATCGGDGWVDRIDFCNTGGPCSGSYHNATTDPLSPLGIFQDTTFCGTRPQCGCSIPTC